MVIQKVSIIGAGVQGSMLAFRCGIYGKRVFVYDIDKGVLDKAYEKINNWLQEYVAAGKLTEAEKNLAVQNITLHSNIGEALKDTDIVMENVPEKLELKQSVWEVIDALAPERALLTSNSSSLRSSEMGIKVKRKDKTFNVNFMTPTKDDLVEVMWNQYTSEETKKLAIGFLKSNKNIPIITHKEIQGFSLNRVWRAIKKECLKLWAEGYITPDDLDRAFMLEWATEYGPFALMDKVGLDVIRDIELSYYRESGDERDLPPQALEEMIEKGFLGEKSGQGFYQYPRPAYEKPDWLKGE